MASKSINSPRVELHESEITKPQPLRIIKRSQTISGIPTSRYQDGARGSSDSSCESKGSPIFGADRPLTVQKKRQQRGSIMEFRSENSGSDLSSSSTSLADLVKDYHGKSRSPLDCTFSDRPTALSELMDDPDVTPKANEKVARTPRTISAGDFLKHELYKPHLNIEADTFSVRGQHRPRMYDQVQNSRPSPASVKVWPPKMPERRPSRSKNFFLRAIGMRNSEEPPKHIRRAGSTASRNTLIRRSSLAQRADDDPLHERTLVPAITYRSFPLDSSDIADVDINARISSCRDTASTPSPSSSPPSAGLPSAFVLCPQITVTPEVCSVETGSCTLWVAVLITGALQRADGYRGSGSFSQSFNHQLLG